MGIDTYKNKIIDINDINLNSLFLHYTNKKNLESILHSGLEPRIGINSKMIEKNKKVFFTKGDIGALVIIDVWLKWMICKPISNLIYWLGAFLLRIPYFPKFIHNIIISFNKRNKRKHIWAYKRMKNILDNSIYLILDLEEKVDFSFDDIDEVKSSFPSSYVKSFYAHDSNINNQFIEYWNLHTYSDKVIKPEKIFILDMDNNFSANEIIKNFAMKNMDYVKENCKFLYQYLDYISNN